MLLLLQLEGKRMVESGSRSSADASVCAPRHKQSVRMCVYICICKPWLYIQTTCADGARQEQLNVS